MKRILLPVLLLLAFFAPRHSSSVIRHSSASTMLPSVAPLSAMSPDIRHPPSAIRHPLFAICHPSPVPRLPSSVLRYQEFHP